MKIRIEIDDSLTEDEVIIRCKSVTDERTAIQKSIQDINSKTQRIIFYKEEKEYYLSLDEILFFETDSSKVSAHTVDDVFQVHNRLYELEEILQDIIDGKFRTCFFVRFYRQNSCKLSE